MDLESSRRIKIFQNMPRPLTPPSPTRGEGKGEGRSETMDQQLIKRAAEDILNSKKTIAFTGAGISVESGIPDFRGAQGLWQKYDPEEYAHIQHFYSDPDRVWLMLKDMFSLIMEAKQNPAHIGLAALERM